MLRQTFESFYVRNERIFARSRCGCEAGIKVEWVLEFAREENIDLSQRKFDQWSPEQKERFLELISKKLSRASLVKRCSLHG